MRLAQQAETQRSGRLPFDDWHQDVNVVRDRAKAPPLHSRLDIVPQTPQLG
jgi:hypothetical protein